LRPTLRQADEEKRDEADTRHGRNITTPEIDGWRVTIVITRSLSPLQTTEATGEWTELAEGAFVEIYGFVSLDGAPDLGKER
jgi:hypothetical protein